MTKQGCRLFPLHEYLSSVWSDLSSFLPHQNGALPTTDDFISVNFKIRIIIDLRDNPTPHISFLLSTFVNILMKISLESDSNAREGRANVLQLT